MANQPYLDRAADDKERYQKELQENGAETVAREDQFEENNAFATELIFPLGTVPSK